MSGLNLANVLKTKDLASGQPDMSVRSVLALRNRGLTLTKIAASAIAPTTRKEMLASIESVRKKS
jgi:hypothetical protein